MKPVGATAWRSPADIFDAAPHRPEIMDGTWKAGAVLAGMARDLAQTWRTLALTDLLAKAITVAILGPAVALLLRWFLQRGGSVGMVTDESILFFFLSPLGLITLVMVGAASGAIYFAEFAALLAITVGAQDGLVVGPLGALRFVARRGHVLVGLALRALVRLHDAGGRGSRETDRDRRRPDAG